MILSNCVASTFYVEVEGIHPQVSHTQQQLIDVCRQSWERNGFQLRVMNMDWIERGRMRSLFQRITLGFPTVNPSRYERACFMRWLAMAMNGGGLMIDYDVVNVNCREIEVADSGLSLLQGGCPSVVYGTAADYWSAIERFMEATRSGCGRTVVHDREHVSDQTIVDQCFGPDIATKFGTVIEYSEHIPPGRHLVHCSTNCTTGSGYERLAAMESLLKIGVE